MTDQPIKPLSEDEIQIMSAHSPYIENRQRELFAELLCNEPPWGVVAVYQIEELFEPLIKKEEKK